MEKVSERVALLREMISSVSTISLTELDSDFQVISTNSTYLDDFMLFLCIDAMHNPEPIGEFPYLEAPVIFTNSLGISWLSDLEYHKGEAYRIFLLGPVFLDGYSVSQIERRLNQEQLSVSVRHRFMSLIKELPIMPVSRFFEYGIMLHCAITGERLSTNDFIYPFLKSGVPQEMALGNGLGSYLAEQEIIKLVEEGNLAYKQAWEKSALSAEIECLAEGDNLRQAKNTVIVFCTLCAGAAIRGGLAPDIAYDLRGKYIYSVEAAQDFPEVAEINRLMFDDYVHKVHRVKNEGEISPQIRDTCEYIGLHLEDKLDIHLLASRLGYSDYYFSRRFKKETGVGVKEYVGKMRIEKAKLLLRTTNREIQNISEALGFGSQSYFGELFRKETGMTPSEYRANLP